MISRRSLLASLSLALPVVAVAAGAQAATSPHRVKHQVHAASAHTVHHKAHRTAATAPARVPTHA